MDWSLVRIEPFGRSDADTMTCCYRLRIPLIGDGRISLAHLVRAPERATVERHLLDLTSRHGAVRLVDNQLTCVWHPDGGAQSPDLRIIGNRFALGDRVALRASGSVIALFQVCERQAEGPVPMVG